MKKIFPISNSFYLYYYILLEILERHFFVFVFVCVCICAFLFCMEIQFGIYIKLLQIDHVNSCKKSILDNFKNIKINKMSVALDFLFACIFLFFSLVCFSGILFFYRAFFFAHVCSLLNFIFASKIYTLI